MLYFFLIILVPLPRFLVPFSCCLGLFQEETLVRIHCFMEDENGEHEKQQDEWIQVLDDFLERFRLETDISLEVDSCSLFVRCVFFE